MQPLRFVAAWLVARPFHGVLGLAFTLVMPLSTLLSGATAVHLLLANGIRVAALQIVAAAVLTALLALILSASVPQLLASATIIWLPAFILAGLMLRFRSLTLALQVSAIVAMLAVVIFFVTVADPLAYWNDVLANSARLFRESGLTDQAQLITDSATVLAPQMTMMASTVAWSISALVLLLGYYMFRQLPKSAEIYGRFCDLDFGRVIAATMAVLSMLTVFTGFVAVQNVAFVAFAVFWLQGLAILHWLHIERGMPVFVLISAYVLLLVLNGLMVVALAIVGYTDAWFGFRRKRSAAA